MVIHPISVCYTVGLKVMSSIKKNIRSHFMLKVVLLILMCQCLQTQIIRICVINTYSYEFTNLC